MSVRTKKRAPSTDSMVQKHGVPTLVRSLLGHIFLELQERFSSSSTIKYKFSPHDYQSIIGLLLKHAHELELPDLFTSNIVPAVKQYSNTLPKRKTWKLAKLSTPYLDIKDQFWEKRGDILPSEIVTRKRTKAKIVKFPVSAVQYMNQQFQQYGSLLTDVNASSLRILVHIQYMLFQNSYPVQFNAGWKLPLLSDIVQYMQALPANNATAGGNESFDVASDADLNNNDDADKFDAMSSSSSSSASSTYSESADATTADTTTADISTVDDATTVTSKIPETDYDKVKNTTSKIMHVQEERNGKDEIEDHKEEEEEEEDEEEELTDEQLHQLDVASEQHDTLPDDLLSHALVRKFDDIPFNVIKMWIKDRPNSLVHSSVLNRQLHRLFKELLVQIPTMILNHVAVDDNNLPFLDVLFQAIGIVPPPAIVKTDHVLENVANQWQRFIQSKMKVWISSLVSHQLITLLAEKVGWLKPIETMLLELEKTHSTVWQQQLIQHTPAFYNDRWFTPLKESPSYWHQTYELIILYHMNENTILFKVLEHLQQTIFAVLLACQYTRGNKQLWREEWHNVISNQTLVWKQFVQDLNVDVNDLILDILHLVHIHRQELSPMLTAALIGSNSMFDVNQLFDLITNEVNSRDLI